jgi:hypothetical protein
MVNGRVLCALALGLAAGCVHVHVGGDGPVQGGQGLEPGDRVVARWKDGLYAATVITVRSNLVTVAWDAPPPEQSHLPRRWVGPLLPVPAGFAAGGWAACADGDAFVLCRVLVLERDTVTIERLGEAKARSLERGKVIALPSGLAAWAADIGGRQAERAARAAMLGTLVPATAGELPKTGAPVLARWHTDGEWWPGAVESISGSIVRVRWHDGSGPEDLPRTDIAPLAPAEPNAFAFCTEGGSARYERAYVRWVTGNLIEIEQKDGSVRELPLGSCVPARPRALPERAPVLP